MHRTNDFFCYHAGKFAIDKQRPWQLCSKFGALLGQFATEEKANAVLDALQADQDAGKLPTNLRDWDKHHLFD